jgi:hypothetical protein
MLQLNYDGTTDLTPFIASASAIVDQVIVLAAKKPNPVFFDAVTPELIERWLACHFYCQVDLLYQSKSTGGASASFQGQTSTDFDSTRYGQTACNIDYSGMLRAIGRRQIAQGFWIGKPPSQQIPYEERN